MSTGHSAWCSRCMPTAPSSSPRRAPCICAPTTTSWASRDRSTSTALGLPSTTSKSAATSGWRRAFVVSGEAPRLAGPQRGWWSGGGGDSVWFGRGEGAGAGDEDGVGEPGDGQQCQQQRGEVGDEGALAGFVTEDAESV